MICNETRAAWGMKAVEQDPDFGKNELDTSVTDTLANIMHLCKVEEFDFEALVGSAEMHFNCECDEEAEQDAEESSETDETYCSSREETDADDSNDA